MLHFANEALQGRLQGGEIPGEQLGLVVVFSGRLHPRPSFLQQLLGRVVLYGTPVGASLVYIMIGIPIPYLRLLYILYK